MMYISYVLWTRCFKQDRHAVVCSDKISQPLVYQFGVFFSLQTNLPEFEGPEKIVIRRYSDFEWLHDRLAEKYKGIFIPPLPEKNVVGKMANFKFNFRWLNSNANNVRLSNG
jgi:hypothetical protein